jgi:hypothetical protein
MLTSMPIVVVLAAAPQAGACAAGHGEAPRLHGQVDTRGGTLRILTRVHYASPSREHTIIIIIITTTTITTIIITFIMSHDQMMHSTCNAL